MKSLKLTIIALVIFGMSLHGIAKSPRAQRHTSQRKPVSGALSSIWAAKNNAAEEDELDRRYEAVKAQAKADPAVQNLKEQSDAAAPGAESQQASIRYTQALYRKIGEIDPALRGRAASVAEAILQRLLE